MTLRNTICNVFVFVFYFYLCIKANISAAILQIHHYNNYLNGFQEAKIPERTCKQSKNFITFEALFYGNFKLLVFQVFVATIHAAVLIIACTWIVTSWCWGHSYFSVSMFHGSLFFSIQYLQCNSVLFCLFICFKRHWKGEPSICHDFHH